MRNTQTATSPSELLLNRGSVQRESSRHSSSPGDPHLGPSNWEDFRTNPKSSERFHFFFCFAAEPTQEHSNLKRDLRSLARNQDENTSGDASYIAERGFLVDRNKVENTLADMHSYLCASQFRKHREYKKCPSSTAEALDNLVARLIQEGRSTKAEPQRRRSRPENGDRAREDESLEEYSYKKYQEEISRSEEKRLLGRKRSLVKISKTLFQFFLPLEFTSEVGAKYWGAVQLLLQVRRPRSFHDRRMHADFSVKGGKKIDRCWNSIELLRDSRSNDSTSMNCTRFCDRIVSALSPSQAPLPYRLKLPDGLIEAWPHLVMFFILSTARQHQEAQYEIVKFKHLVDGSWAEILKSLATESIHSREAVLPFGITSLVIRNLLEDVTLGLPDIASIYSESLEKLV